ncbi:grasp-with-spasm system SPASM domain peptide maturase [Pseudotamlana carrageenivorans]|uniref:Grasp-with-spasm system SPASM domain peptide maturase n=1 Tax=Pseudotamlana carrageenivorans TaxID=2069432 RepID=A0A2I7SLG3_9FLAO|nr:grasp-with-spasm system SPASM domain peptide maturase [Tamlana carrageenivorans]AUS06722.1 grasp-with-spasm system SPASM domain peptide maturase [Tamlana carrageenivorans]
MKKYYRFYECCKLVRGANRTAVYDLQRLNLYFIPNSVIEVFKDYENKGIDTLFSDYSSQKEHLEKHFDYLLSSEIIFTTDNKDVFPAMSSAIEKPLYLDFLFIEIDSLQEFKKSFLENFIDNTGVEHIVIINSSNSTENLNKVLKLLNESRVKLITFISLFDDNLIKEVIALKNKHERLKKLIFFNSPNNDITNTEDESVEYFKNDLNKLLTRRISGIKSFTLNIKAYLESLNHNLYFNRRAYINNNGEVKPSFVHREYYGNIKDEDIKTIVFKEGFQHLWALTKDKIGVCKDCEFRYMCPDNRIPIKIEDRYIHNTDCNYSPYTNTWNEK